MKLSAALPVLCAAAGLLAVTRAAAVTPVEKVIALLTDLKTEVEAEGAAEAKNYDEFACFCSKFTSGKSSSILTGRDEIESLSAEIESKTALKVTKETELTERKATQEQLAADLKATQVQCAADKAEYLAEAEDLTKAIAGLTEAEKALTASKPGGAPQLLELKSSLQTAVSLAESLQLKGAKHNELVAFLQQGVDPLDPTYKFHSQGIIDTIKSLLQEFTDKKTELDAEWIRTKTTCLNKIQSLEDSMGSNVDAMVQLGLDIDGLKGDVALARTNLLYSEAMLKDDQTYLKDLTERCEFRAKDWDQRSQMRADELEAISGALAILEQNVSGLDAAVNIRALIQKPRLNASNSSAAGSSAARALRGAPALVQAVSAEVRSHGFLRSQAKSSLEAKQQAVATLLRQEGVRLHSTALTVLASRLSADPFEKVKKLIQQLIERLLSEATAEATKKGFCDEELGKARKDRDYRYADVQKLNSELALLEAKEDELTVEIDQLTQDIDALKAALTLATENRELERLQNVAILKDANDGLVALKEAISILKVFYKRAGKATVLAQASPIDEDTSGPGFRGAYTGKQEASKGIIGMLEVIQTDFERTIRMTTAAEAQSLADFVLFDRASKEDISGKETKKKLNEEDLAETQSTIAEKMEDLQTAIDLVDSALKVLESLKPTCIDTAMSYEDRVAKREEEIAALKKAVCILDPEGKEAGCPAP